MVVVGPGPVANPSADHGSARGQARPLSSGTPLDSHAAHASLLAAAPGADTVAVVHDVAARRLLSSSRLSFSPASMKTRGPRTPNLDTHAGNRACLR